MTKDERRLKKLFDYWAKILGLFETWDIQLEISQHENPDDPSVVLDITYDWSYLHAKIRAYMPTVREQSDASLTYHVAHELSHIPVGLAAGRVTPTTQMHVEHTTSMIGRALVRAMNAEPVRL